MLSVENSFLLAFQRVSLYVSLEMILSVILQVYMKKTYSLTLIICSVQSRREKIPFFYLLESFFAKAFSCYFSAHISCECPCCICSTKGKKKERKKKNQTLSKLFHFNLFLYLIDKLKVC